MSRAQGRSAAVEDLVRAVEEFVAATDRERRSRRRMLEELGRLERPFDQGADEVHVTGSAVVAGPRGILLHRHKRLGLWLQPGGHIEEGESPAEAARRESREETGVAADHPPEGPHLLHIDVHEAYAGHVHLDTRYLLLAGDDDPRPPEGESQDVRWFTLTEAQAVADPALIDALRRLPE